MCRSLMVLMVGILVMQIWKENQNNCGFKSEFYTQMLQILKFIMKQTDFYSV